MKIESQVHSDVLVVTVNETVVDAMLAGDFREQLIRFTEGNDDFVVDLSEVRMVDSSGLAALIGARKALNGRGTVVLANVNECVQKVLTLTGLVRVFDVFPSVAEAISSLQKRAVESENKA